MVIKAKGEGALHEVIATGPFDGTWESLMTTYSAPAWYEDGKFGIFIHWGPYAVPAFENEWYPRNMYLPGARAYNHHVETYGPHATFGYKDFIPQFTAPRFDPDAWARLFKEAGARYVVPVAEHHDGFAMYDCSFTRWNSVRMGPRRDVLGELAAAVRREGLVFGTSYHRAENWWFFNGGREIPSDVQEPDYADLYGPAQPRPETNPPDKTFLDGWMARLIELVDRYQPQLVYFDWWIEQPAFRPYLAQFAAYYYNRAAQSNQGVVINYKDGEIEGNSAFPEGAAVFDIERGQMSSTAPRFWQSDSSMMRNSWCDVASPEYKPVSELIGDLVDVVSKNGALLLNVGPRADGSIPDEATARLRAIGEWLNVNGAAIYGSRPWRLFGEGPTETAAVGHGMYGDVHGREFTENDIRFTTRDGALYATFLAWPESGRVSITSLGENTGLLPVPITRVELLGSAAPLTWEREAGALQVTLPAGPARDQPGVLKITAMEMTSRYRLDASGTSTAKRGGSATDQAIEKIKELISSGDFTAGSRLPAERELTQRFGVSRSSLREAVRALALVGVLESRVGDGTYVTTLEPDLLLTGIGFVSDLMEADTLLQLHGVRRILEPAATRLATHRLTDDDLAQLRACVGRMETAESVAEYIDADAAFHRVILDACGNPALASLIQNLAGKSLRARLWQSAMAHDAVEETLADYRAIVQSLEARDAERAAAADTMHLAVAENWIRRLADQLVADGD